MGEFLGKLHETAVRFPKTDIWMDSCGEEELEYGLKRRIVGATSNPIIVGAVVKKELEFWEPKIQELIREMPKADEDELAWALIDEVGRLRSPKLLPVYRKFGGKKGRLSIQTNIKYYRNAEKMTEQAVHLSSLGENMMVKIPASAAGIQAMEEATFLGVSINATVSFTVSQAVAVAEAVERGLARRKNAGLPVEQMGPVCTLMLGRTDDWCKKYVSREGLVTDPECLEWAGIAVLKEAYRIYQKRGYTTRLLTAACRNHYHWSALIGGDLAQTINYSWFQRFDNSGIEVKDRMAEPVPARYLAELMQLSEFRKSFEETGQKPEEFETYGGFKDTLQGFLAGYDDLIGLIRGYLIR